MTTKSDFDKPVSIYTQQLRFKAYIILRLIIKRLKAGEQISYTDFKLSEQDPYRRACLALMRTSLPILITVDDTHARINGSRVVFKVRVMSLPEAKRYLSAVNMLRSCPIYKPTWEKHVL